MMVEYNDPENFPQLKKDVTAGKVYSIMLAFQ